MASCSLPRHQVAAVDCGAAAALCRFRGPVPVLFSLVRDQRCRLRLESSGKLADLQMHCDGCWRAHQPSLTCLAALPGS
jgi:hypothetical protein